TNIPETSMPKQNIEVFLDKDNHNIGDLIAVARAKIIEKTGKNTNTDLGFVMASYDCEGLKCIANRLNLQFTTGPRISCGIYELLADSRRRFEVLTDYVFDMQNNFVFANSTPAPPQTLDRIKWEDLPINLDR